MKKENIKNKLKVKNLGWKIALIVFYTVMLFVLQASNVLAADNPIAVVNNLSNFVCIINYAERRIYESIFKTIIVFRKLIR